MKKIEVKLAFLSLFFVFCFLPGNSPLELIKFSKKSSPLAKIDTFLPSLPPRLEKKIDFLPQITAESVILQDFDSGQILFSKNEEKKLSPASLTKIMTAVVALEEMGQEEMIVLPKMEYYGQIVGLKEGELWRIKDLLYGLLVMSGNDIAYALADSYPGGREAFVDQMNQKAKALGMTSSRFVNPCGRYHLQHYSTASDLSRLTFYIWQNDFFREIVKTNQSNICDVTGDYCYQIYSTNELLGTFPGILGIKTGWTPEAGECFISFWEKNNRRLISIILNSENRFLDTQNLLAWGAINFNYQSVKAVNFLFPPHFESN